MSFDRLHMFTFCTEYRQRVFQDIIDGNMEEPNELAALLYEDRFYNLGVDRIRDKIYGHPHPKVVQFFVEKNPNSDGGVSDAMERACRLGHLAVIKEYLIHYKWPSWANKLYYLTVSIKYKHHDISEYLLSNGYNPRMKEMLLACDFGCLPVVKYFFTHTESWDNATQKSGVVVISLAFLKACMAGHLDIVKYLTPQEGVIHCDDVLRIILQTGGFELVKAMCNLLTTGKLVDKLTHNHYAPGLKVQCYIMVKIPGLVTDYGCWDCRDYVDFLVGWFKGIIQFSEYPQLTKHPYYDGNIGMIVCLYLD